MKEEKKKLASATATMTCQKRGEPNGMTTQDWVTASA